MIKNKVIISIILVFTFIFPTFIFFIKENYIPHILVLACCIILYAYARIFENAVEVIKRNRYEYIELFISNLFYLSVLSLSFWCLVWFIINF
jgi:c-di-AMP phosphodiesterase-like protein